MGEPGTRIKIQDKSSEKAKRDENPAAKKTRKRRLTDTIIQSEIESNKRKKRDTWTTEEKGGTTGRQRRGDKKDIEAEDAEQPQVVEQEKETRCRRKRVRGG